jgi:hypothetical protein
MTIDLSLASACASVKRYKCYNNGLCWNMEKNASVATFGFAIAQPVRQKADAINDWPRPLPWRGGAGADNVFIRLGGLIASEFHILP